MLEPHESIPYNPDIANVFYRAGYIETWGRGIEKISNACRDLGAEQPTYQMIGNSLRVFFPALQSALVTEDGIPNGHDGGLGGGLEKEIIRLISSDPAITVDKIVEKLQAAKRSVERAMKKLRESGRIVREGGKRYGRWKILQ